jgi:hypothetical protein
MNGRDDDTVRFQVDPRLRATGEPMKAPNPEAPAKPDRSFEFFGGVSYPGRTSPPPSPASALLASQDRAGNPDPGAAPRPPVSRPHRGGEARRQRLHRERVRDGFICVTIPIHASEVDGLLIARQFLKPELRNDRLAVADALCDLLETL